MRRSLSALALMGAIVFTSYRMACADIVGVEVSTGPLIGPTTGPAPVVLEPFWNPFGTKHPRIVSGFGKRVIANQPLPEAHEGIDYAAPLGTVVKASRSGKVLFAGFSKMYASRTDKTEQDRFIILRHPDGMSTRYVHVGGIRVRPGSEVKQGQAIAVTAESDEWTGPVLHFEIRDVRGQALNPTTLLKDMSQP